MPQIPIFYDIAHKVSALVSLTYAGTLYGIQVRATIANQVRNGPKEVAFPYPSIPYSEWYSDSQIELLSWMTRTALELIGQSGFGQLEYLGSFTRVAIPDAYTSRRLPMFSTLTTQHSF